MLNCNAVLLKFGIALARLSFFDALMDCATPIKTSKNQLEAKLYADYILVFESWISGGVRSEATWYDLRKLIEFDFVRAEGASLERAVVVVRDVLWELLVTMSDKMCPDHDDSFLRVFMDGLKQHVYYCCDVCSFAQDIDGRRVDFVGVVIPADDGFIIERCIVLFDLNKFT